MINDWENTTVREKIHRSFQNLLKNLNLKIKVKKNSYFVLLDMLGELKFEAMANLFLNL